jgi:probable F420-dependent oxidoreductase
MKITNLDDVHGIAVGAVFQHGLVGTNVDEIRRYVQGVEAIGLTQLVAYDHVLGVGLGTRPGWTGPYSEEDAFHEPLTLFAFMAGITERLEFATCVLVLPQRQTALVAKQAAQVQIVSGGRFRLGVGTGWNVTEYEALGVPFERRGARLDEQIAVLRGLWSQPTVNLSGEFHQIDDAGINPLPATPIPIWVGGSASHRVRERIARLADGWMVPRLERGPAAEVAADLRRICEQHGRDPNTLGIEARLYLGQVPRSRWQEEVHQWAAIGASRLNLITDGMGLSTVQQELEVLADAAAAIG